MFIEMEPNKVIKIVEVVLAIVSTVVALLKKSFPDLDAKDNE